MNEAPFNAAVLTISDRCARGEMSDTSGPSLEEMLSRRLAARIVATACVPDERDAIADRLRQWALHEPRPDLILTTGGTGLSPRDVTPEATEPLLERRHPALLEVARHRCGQKTPLAYLSRGVAGTLAGTLIINLPGSRAGATEMLDAMLDILPHALGTLRGEPHKNSPMKLPAYILAGGKSSRFGADKARAELGGAPLLVRIAQALRRCASDITAVADVPGKYDDLGVITIADRIPGLGPIGGLATALRDARDAEWLLLVSCDMLDVRPDWVRSLLRYRHPAVEVIAFRSDRWEPLLALYRTTLLPRVDQQIARGELAMQRLIDASAAIALALPDDWPPIAQANTPLDLAQAARRFTARKQIAHAHEGFTDPGIGEPSGRTADGDDLQCNTNGDCHATPAPH